MSEKRVWYVLKGAEVDGGVEVARTERDVVILRSRSQELIVVPVSKVFDRQSAAYLKAMGMAQADARIYLQIAVGHSEMFAKATAEEQEEARKRSEEDKQPLDAFNAPIFPDLQGKDFRTEPAMAIGGSQKEDMLRGD